MTDIVERLRTLISYARDSGMKTETLEDAKREIERLRGVAPAPLDPATVEACAKFVEQHQERITEADNGPERSVSPRMVGNQMGLAYAAGLRGLVVSPPDRGTP